MLSFTAVLSLTSLACSVLQGVALEVPDERLIGWKGETHHTNGESCRDDNDNCEDWAENKECERNPAFMEKTCRLSCKVCVGPASTPQAFPMTDEGREVGQLHLNTGTLMPTIGFGTAGMGCGLSKRAVTSALKAGYRHIDTAQAHEWYCEEKVGEAIAASGIPREDLFIVTKQHPRDHGFERTKEMFQSSLTNLHTDYIDLMHLHYPQCWGTLCAGSQPSGTWRDAWRALEELYHAGQVRALGVSNFSPQELSQLLEIATVRPAVVQSHSDPLRPNWELQRMCKEEGIVFTAYSSLGTQHGFSRPNPVLNSPVIKAVGEGVSKSPAQVVLRWALDHNQ
ncbi:hypothetical protein CYMTET_45217, partial [Cymbomonas tetramitiformis]